MPKGYFHESWRRLAAESDYILEQPEAAAEMVKVELLLFPIHRLQGELKEVTVTKAYTKQIVEYRRQKQVLKLPYDKQVDEAMVNDGWERTLKTYQRTFETRRQGEFARTEPVWVPVMKRTKIAPEAFIRCKPYVTKMYNATFPKKVHVSGHLWIEPVRIVSQRVTFDSFTYYNEPHISSEMAAMIYNKGGSYE